MREEKMPENKEPTTHIFSFNYHHGGYSRDTIFVRNQIAFKVTKRALKRSQKDLDPIGSGDWEVTAIDVSNTPEGEKALKIAQNKADQRAKEHERLRKLDELKQFIRDNGKRIEREQGCLVEIPNGTIIDGSLEDDYTGTAQLLLETENSIWYIINNSASVTGYDYNTIFTSPSEAGAYGWKIPVNTIPDDLYKAVKLKGARM